MHPTRLRDADRINLYQLRGDLQGVYHRNMLEAQELRALIQRNERMRIVNQNAPCGGWYWWGARAAAQRSRLLLSLIHI